MAERLLIHPPEIVELEDDDSVVFLGGPIQGAPKWQTPAAEIIHSLDPSIVIASPRKEYEPGTFKYNRQVDWETALLRRAGRFGVVAFWLPEAAPEKLHIPERVRTAASVLLTGMLPKQRAYGQTSRFELAEWKKTHQYEGAKITIGLEDEFGNARYIRRRFSQDCPDVKIVDNLEEMCQNAVELARRAA